MGGPVPVRAPPAGGSVPHPPARVGAAAAALCASGERHGSCGPNTPGTAPAWCRQWEAPLEVSRVRGRGLTHLLSTRRRRRGPPAPAPAAAAPGTRAGRRRRGAGARAPSRSCTCAARAWRPVTCAAWTARRCCCCASTLVSCYGACAGIELRFYAAVWPGAPARGGCA